MICPEKASAFHSSWDLNTSLLFESVVLTKPSAQKLLLAISRFLSFLCKVIQRSRIKKSVEYITTCFEKASAFYYGQHLHSHLIFVSVVVSFG